MLQETLKALEIPALKSRGEMIEILERELFGKIPPAPEKLEFSVEQEPLFPKFCAGKAVSRLMRANCVIGGKKFSFPFHVAIPAKEGKHPFFVMPNFRPEIPDRHQPTEEIIDRGFAVLSFCYQDVTADDADFTSGLAGVLYENGVRKSPADPGKISMWAWAAMRVMDYAQTLGDVLDLAHGTICGHSRLGKTALWTGANDPRFFVTYSNDSGCSGAALARGDKTHSKFGNKKCEDVEDICRRFHYWFCENYDQYRKNEAAMPFDQHYLIAAIAPRKVLIGSASLDGWADPAKEYLACLAASPAFEKGFVCPDRLPGEDDFFSEGDIAYQIRPGLHYFSRTDWNRLCDFVEMKKKS